ncbi:hypothetical protein [Paenibacillus wenxiniae]|uniref:Uncharacterized protein n=1 Tax=Paenibacillus wenxiniae TaxID=1636843 RepID=A0ABW4RMC5_9BACL
MNDSDISLTTKARPVSIIAMVIRMGWGRAIGISVCCTGQPADLAACRQTRAALERDDTELFI